MRKQLNIAVDDASSPIRGRFDNAAPADEAQLHVRRLSSPIFAEGTLEQEEHDIRDESADAIQAWWRKTRTLQKAAAAADSAAAAFAKVAALVDSLASASKPSFESAQTELQTPPLQQAAAAALSCLPRDPVLAARPHAARSARAFLSAVMIAAFPAEVLSEDPEVGGEASDTLAAPEVRALRCAAALLVASARALCTAVADLHKTHGPGAVQHVGVRLGGVRFARRFYADAFLKWKVVSMPGLSFHI
eukprot:7871-Heterococcus_DN1.PRE.1